MIICCSFQCFMVDRDGAVSINRRYRDGRLDWPIIWILIGMKKFACLVSLYDLPTSQWKKSPHPQILRADMWHQNETKNSALLQEVHTHTYWPRSMLLPFRQLYENQCFISWFLWFWSHCTNMNHIVLRWIF